MSEERGLFYVASASLMDLAKRMEQGEADTQPALVAAMRAFEPFSPLLRYPESRGWHTCDQIGMRAAIVAAIRALASEGRT